MSTPDGILSTQYRTLFSDNQRDTDPVVVFSIFNECVPPCTWSVDQLSVAPPGSGVHNDGFPLSKPPLGRRFVFCASVDNAARLAMVKSSNNFLYQCISRTSI